MTINRGPGVGALLGFGLCLALAAHAATPGPVGDAGRGRVLFEEKGCGRCHRPQQESPGQGPPLEVIRRPQGMRQLAGRLWNHAPAMFDTFEKEGLKWPELVPEQMADLMAYLQGEPLRDPAPDLFQGRVVLVRKGCLKCHSLQGEGGSSAVDLTRYRDRYDAIAVWAATVWNHSPKMASRATMLGVPYPRFSGDEMGNLLEFLRSVSGSR